MTEITFVVEANRKEEGDKLGERLAGVKLSSPDLAPAPVLLPTGAGVG